MSTNQHSLSVAIDLGTTTLVFACINASGDILAQISMPNSQRRFGVDVITRILSSNKGKNLLLQNAIRADLQKGVALLKEKLPKDLRHLPIEKVCIAGNTTMIHLLMNYSCAGLGTYPYTPQSLKALTLNSAQIFGAVLSDATVYIFPGISAFVGGDIVAGLTGLNFDEAFLLTDLGTNGEMALWDREHLYVCSSPAGPAFEGGHIHCGVPGIPGAIYHVDYREATKTFSFETIEDATPTGLCGTGLLDLLAALRQSGFMDKTGLLSTDYFTNGFLLCENVALLQDDIRELQMAKAAIAAGVLVLLTVAGLSPDMISNVYVSGNIGDNLKVDTAITVGLFPDELKNAIHGIGNSSLKGAIAYLVSPNETLERTQKILEKAEELYLSQNPDFNRIYIEQMNF
ncbi:MAG: ASKHA domain-containing protein [Lachnospiraceae bacterium]|nr:ASKHA domain-containing protein [Lachnospiraceae bacterium]